MNAMAPYSMVVFGDGWRARFFCRMAAAIPDALEVRAVIGHHRDRLESIEREYGVRASTDAALLRRCDPDFVALAVSWPAMPGMIETMAGEGCHVLCETRRLPILKGCAGCGRVWPTGPNWCRSGSSTIACPAMRRGWR